MSLKNPDRYDRQIRAWGFETQKRLECCSFLFIGINEASIECTKNLILAGVMEIHYINIGNNQNIC